MVGAVPGAGWQAGSGTSWHPSRLGTVVPLEGEQGRVSQGSPTGKAGPGPWRPRPRTDPATALSQLAAHLCRVPERLLGKR